MKLVVVFAFFLGIFVFFALPANANVLTQQNLVNSLFSIPSNDDSNTVWGQYKLWQNSSATTSLENLTLFIKGKVNLDCSLRLRQVNNSPGFVWVGATGNLDCFDWSEISQATSTLTDTFGYKRCQAINCSSPESCGGVVDCCTILPEAYLNFSIGCSENDIHDNNYDVQISGLNYDNLTSSWWQSFTDYTTTAFDTASSTNFSDLAFIFCDTYNCSMTISGTAIIPEITCENWNFDNFGIGLAICNTFSYLFIPTSVSVENYQNLSTIFQSKAPFAYFYSITNAFNSLSSTTTPAFILSTSTGALDTTIFQPLKTGLTWILWLLFGVFCIKRVAKFDF
jgi:hypothetical protein